MHFLVAEVIDRFVGHTGVERGGRALATALGTMSNYTDVDAVVLGGALPRLFPWIGPQIDEFVAARAKSVPGFSMRTIIASEDIDAPKTGASLHARNRVLADPAAVPYQSARGD